MRRIVFHKQRPVKKDLLALALRNIVFVPILRRIAGIPLKTDTCGQSLERSHHAACISSLYTAVNSAATAGAASLARCPSVRDDPYTSITQAELLREQPMQITKGSYTFDWNSDWAQIPANVKLGYTHGVVVDKRGRVHVFNQSEHGVLTFDADGGFAGTWKEFPSRRFVGAHGMTLIEEGGTEYLWLTDQTSCEVVKTTLDGETVLRIETPGSKGPYKSDARYCPTWATQSPTDGTIYVADGYGSSYINLYDKNGKYLESWSGEKGMGRFACPHGVSIFNRKQATGHDEPVLYVTDRGNSRVQVFDLKGGFIKSFYQDHPCCFSQSGKGELLVPDLYAFINVYDGNDQPAATKLGDNQHGIVGHDGWPNVPTAKIEDGKFNSPHGGSFDAHGNIYIVEWIAAGRVTKLTRV